VRWLDASLDCVPPKSLTGKALSYLDKQWPKLVRYLDAVAPVQVAV